MTTSKTATLVKKNVHFRFGENEDFFVTLTFSESEGVYYPDSSSEKFINFVESKGTHVRSLICKHDNLQIIFSEHSTKSLMIRKKAILLDLPLKTGDFFRKNKEESIERSKEIAKEIRARTNGAS